MTLLTFKPFIITIIIIIILSIISQWSSNIDPNIVVFNTKYCLDSSSIIQVRKPQRVDSVDLHGAFSVRQKFVQVNRISFFK